MLLSFFYRLNSLLNKVPAAARTNSAFSCCNPNQKLKNECLRLGKIEPYQKNAVRTMPFCKFLPCFCKTIRQPEIICWCDLRTKKPASTNSMANTGLHVFRLPQPPHTPQQPLFPCSSFFSLFKTGNSTSLAGASFCSLTSFT